jgi:hypothetical protein
MIADFTGQRNFPDFWQFKTMHIFHIYSTVFVKVYYVHPIIVFSKLLQKFRSENMYNVVWWDEAYTVKKVSSFLGKW